MLNKIINWQMELIQLTSKLTVKVASNMSKFFSKSAVSTSDSRLEEIEMMIKKSPAPSTDFMKDFDTTKSHSVFVTGATSMKVERQRESPPMPMNSHTKNLLKNSIVISLPFTIDRSDLEFIAFSKKDHQPIYRYVGGDFRKFDLPYTEMVGIGDLPAPPQQQPRSHGRKLPNVSKTDLEQI
jgi:hypothetical protein